MASAAAIPKILNFITLPPCSTFPFARPPPPRPLPAAKRRRDAPARFLNIAARAANAHPNKIVGRDAEHPAGGEADMRLLQDAPAGGARIRLAGDGEHDVHAGS